MAGILLSNMGMTIKIPDILGATESKEYKLYYARSLQNRLAEDYDSYVLPMVDLLTSHYPSIIVGKPPPDDMYQIHSNDFLFLMHSKDYIVLDMRLQSNYKFDAPPDVQYGISNVNLQRLISDAQMAPASTLTDDMQLVRNIIAMFDDISAPPT